MWTGMGGHQHTLNESVFESENEDDRKYLKGEENRRRGDGGRRKIGCAGIWDFIKAMMQTEAIHQKKKEEKTDVSRRDS